MIILESNQVLFPKHTLRLDGLTVDEKVFVVNAIKEHAGKEKIQVVDTRGGTINDLSSNEHASQERI